MVEAQLAPPRLDANARIASLNLSARPLREVLDAIAQAGGITLRYAQKTAWPEGPVGVTLPDQTVGDALQGVLRDHGLTFQAMGPKAAFIYPDTPENREKYLASIRVFPIAKADPVVLTQQLSKLMKPTTDGFRATVVTLREPRTLIVRAVPELMSWIATWIVENDKTEASRD
jgi:sugar phosphate isomerase/epimerase